MKGLLVERFRALGLRMKGLLVERFRALGFPFKGGSYKDFLE